MRTAVLLCCLVTACEAGEKKPAPPPAPAKARWVATAVVGLDLTYLPTDADLILRIDVAALRQSKLWSTYEHDLATALLPSVDCDHAPLRDVSTVEIGIALKTEVGVFVVRGLDRDKMLRCLHASSAARFDGDFVTVPRANGKTTDILTFVDSTTMVMQQGKQPTKLSLAQVVHVFDAPLRRDQSFSTAMKRLPPKASITIVSRPNSEEMRKQSQMGIPFQYFFASMDVIEQPTSVQLHFAMVFASTDTATQATSMVQAQVKSPGVKQMFERFDVGSHGDTMTMDIAVTENQLATLAGVFRALSPR